MSADERVATVRLSYGAARTISREAQASMWDGNETGGILLGDYGNDGSVRIRFAGTPGINAVRRQDFFLRDLEHTRSYAEHCFHRYGVVWVGEWHTHPGHAPVPSIRDLATYDAMLTDPDLRFGAEFIAIISAPSHQNPVRWDLAAWACVGLTYRPLPIERHAATD
ncbi:MULTISPECIES: Mov34/MPN/PAD-1 family protein [unclassified Nocardia]|uniref:Mov34/MPN/PAD-1 family protein n=1 Tax=unclassified Nocardia TaxID=2637762 RepID=UPI00278C60D5|nr:MULTISPECIES: Mov34/MPN/PAD-1 family protein [unclassified Nocardia]